MSCIALAYREAIQGKNIEIIPMAFVQCLYLFEKCIKEKSKEDMSSDIITKDLNAFFVDYLRKTRHNIKYLADRTLVSFILSLAGMLEQEIPYAGFISRMLGIFTKNSYPIRLKTYLIKISVKLDKLIEPDLESRTINGGHLTISHAIHYINHIFNCNTESVDFYLAKYRS
jgi:hypothetical protein